MTVVSSRETEPLYVTQSLQLVQATEKVVLLRAPHLQLWAFLILGNASSSLPKEHRLRCHRASGITGGGWDRDNSEEWNRVGHPWPKENGNDVEAAAWLTLDSTFFKREQRISEKHRAPHVFSFLPLCQFHSHPPLLQQPTLLDLSRMWPHLMMTAEALLQTG